MAMFGNSGRETYDALYSTLQQPADVSALEREQAPGAFEGSIGEAVSKGAQTIGQRAGIAALQGARAAPFPQLQLYGIDLDEQLKSDIDKDLRTQTTKMAQTIKNLKLDPKTNGMAAQLVHGVVDVLGTVGASALTGYGAPMAAYTYGISQAEAGKAEGLDPLTAYAKGAIEGGAMGVSVALPAALTGGLAFRTATGAALNVGVGIPERLAVSTLLNSRGYSEMARQYAPLDSTAIATELVLGAAFGGLMGPRVKGAKLPPPEAVPPSAVDAALVANQQAHAEIDVAPGVPIDTRTRQAHTAAMNQAVESMVMGRDVNVESLLKDAGFLGKRPDFDALRVIADELDKAGAADLVTQVRALESEAQARGLVVEPDTLGSVLLSDKAVEPSMDGPMMRESKVRIGEDYVPTRLMLVEAQDVQATMMKAENQFRDRTRVASEQQIQDMASRLDAALLMDAPVMDYGAPVLAADGTVIGGNGRAAAVGRAYETGAAQAYRDALRAEFGDAVDGMQRPMLVRVLQREVDVAKAAILSNEGGGLRMSALEQAKVDAERLGDFRAFEFSEDGDVNLAANMPFIRSWVAEMPQNQRAAIMDADGRLSAEGAGRLRNAILYRAYGDSPTLSRLVEATDPGSRNIAAALTRSAPAVADAREAIARGDMYPMGLHDDLVSAVEKLDSLRRTGLSVADWTKQIDAFGDGMTPEARLLVQFMDQNIRSTRVISDGVFGFYNRLLEAGSPKQGSMFEAAQPDKMRMLTLALDGQAPMYSRGGRDAGNALNGVLGVDDVLFPRSADGAIDTESMAFRDWFGQGAASKDAWYDSKNGNRVVVEGRYGNPPEAQKLFHGTKKAFSSFNAGDGAAGPGVYLAFENKKAKVFAGDGGRVLEVYTNVKNPYFVTADRLIEARELNQWARNNGYDALFIPSVGELVVFDPKSVVIDNVPQKVGAGDTARMSRGAGAAETADTLTTALRAQFGRDADRLVQAGRIKFVESANQLPAGPHPADVRGMYYGGDSYIVAGNTPMSAIRGLALHEIGVHAGFRDMLGDALYNDVLARIEAKIGTDPVFSEARALAEARANRPDHVPEETLAYLIENAPEMPLVRRVLAAIRQWLYRVTGGRFVDLNQADLQMMAVASLRRYARMAEVEARGEDAPFYMTLFHGSPTAFKPEPGAPLGALRWKYINTGEGAQAYGYGHYLAQQEWIARTRYRDRLVKQRSGMASMTIERPGMEPFTFTGDQGAAYRVGDQIVHPKMGGEAGGIAWVIRELKSGSTVEDVRDWAKLELDAAKRELGLTKNLSDEDPEMLRIRDEVVIAEAALRALDEVTVDVPERWMLSGDGLADQFFFDEAAARAAQKQAGKGSVSLYDEPGRVLRPDIEEVRPEPPKGALYGKFIPDETWNQMMIWDAPMDAQPAAVQKFFDRLQKIESDSIMALTADDAYSWLSRKINNGDYGDEFGQMVQSADYEVRSRRADEGADPAEIDYDPRADEIASVMMHMAGIPGHRFLDGETRAAGWDSPDARFNVVLYSDDLGRVAWEARTGDNEWVTANGKGRVVREGGDYFRAFVDGKEITREPVLLSEATRLAEQALDGQLYSRGATMEADPIEDTTLPDARLLAGQADAEIATATELSQGFIPAVECAMRVGA
jgi:hypothetical protein